LVNGILVDIIGAEVLSTIIAKIEAEKDSRNEKQLQEQNTIVEMIDGTSHTFDSDDCVLMFKKFRSVYGPDLFNT
jgi:hypothetical protein